MTDAGGLRAILVAGALVALAHGLLLRSLHPEEFNRGGRPHDGLSHPSLFEQVSRSKEEEIREMFEFAQAPSDFRRCSDIPDSETLAFKVPEGCATSASTVPRSSYMASAFVNNYRGEDITNGGLLDGVGAFEDLGFGGSAWNAPA